MPLRKARWGQMSHRRFPFLFKKGSQELSLGASSSLQWNKTRIKCCSNCNAVLLKLFVTKSGPALIAELKSVECLNTTLQQICFQQRQNLPPVAAFSCPVKDQHRGRGLLPQMPLFALSLDATQLLLFLNILAGVLSGGESCTFACQQGCVTEP